MDSALAGVIGAAGGAILGGGAKVLQDHLGHRLASRTAARILTVSIQHIRNDASAILEVGSWRAEHERWQQPLATWEKHQEALARVLGADDFENVAFLFWHASIIRPSFPVPTGENRTEVMDLDEDFRVPLRWIVEEADDALRIIKIARLSVAEKTRAFADLDRTPPNGVGSGDDSGPPSRPPDSDVG